nr:glycoside hydrolase family 99-like domain-containing protein [Prevotella sp. E9-3]
MVYHRTVQTPGIYTGATPDKFKQHIMQAFSLIKDKEPEHQIVILKSWNEWGEGNYVEPDQEFGHGWLDAVYKAINNK